MKYLVFMGIFNLYCRHSDREGLRCDADFGGVLAGILVVGLMPA